MVPYRTVIMVGLTLLVLSGPPGWTWRETAWATGVTVFYVIIPLVRWLLRQHRRNS